jgi:hypothetical protein
MNAVQPKPFVNTKVNNALQMKAKADYSGQPQHVPFFQVLKYSSNNALYFFVTANVFTTYYIANHFQDDNTNQKYIYLAISLYLTQIIFNYLDINDKTNLSRLEALEKPQSS